MGNCKHGLSQGGLALCFICIREDQAEFTRQCNEVAQYNQLIQSGAYNLEATKHAFHGLQDKPAPELTVANVQLARIERLEREADAIRKAAADALAVVTRERDNALLRGDLALWAERNALEGQNRIGDKAGALQDRLVREMGRKAFDAWACSTKGLIAPMDETETERKERT